MSATGSTQQGGSTGSAVIGFVVIGFFWLFVLGAFTYGIGGTPVAALWVTCAALHWVIVAVRIGSGRRRSSGKEIGHWWLWTLVAPIGLLYTVPADREVDAAGRPARSERMAVPAAKAPRPAAARTERSIEPSTRIARADRDRIQSALQALAQDAHQVATNATALSDRLYRGIDRVDLHRRTALLDGDLERLQDRSRRLLELEETAFRRPAPVVEPQPVKPAPSAAAAVPNLQRRFGRLSLVAPCSRSPGRHSRARLAHPGRVFASEPRPRPSGRTRTRTRRRHRDAARRRVPRLAGGKPRLDRGSGARRYRRVHLGDRLRSGDLDEAPFRTAARCRRNGRRGNRRRLRNAARRGRAVRHGAALARPPRRRADRCGGSVRSDSLVVGNGRGARSGRRDRRSRACSLWRWPVRSRHGLRRRRAGRRLVACDLAPMAAPPPHLRRRQPAAAVRDRRLAADRNVWPGHGLGRGLLCPLPRHRAAAAAPCCLPSGSIRWRRRS